MKSRVSSEPQKILVVDDETELVETFVRFFEYLGYSCTKAHDRPQAVDLIDAERPVLVLTDLRLPTGDGLEVMKHVREKWPGTPVILMTAYHTEEVAKAASELGATGYLRKPFTNAQLASAINAALGLPRT